MERREDLDFNVEYFCTHIIFSYLPEVLMIVSWTFSATFSLLTLSKDSLVGALILLSLFMSSNDSLEDVSLEDSSIASLLVKFPSLPLEALLLLLVSEHSRVLLERTSSLDLMMTMPMLTLFYNVFYILLLPEL